MVQRSNLARSRSFFREHIPALGECVVNELRGEKLQNVCCETQVLQQTGGGLRNCKHSRYSLTFDEDP